MEVGSRAKEGEKEGIRKEGSCSHSDFLKLKFYLNLEPTWYLLTSFIAIELRMNLNFLAVRKEAWSKRRILLRREE